jgi:hypothetical protein
MRARRVMSARGAPARRALIVAGLLHYGVCAHVVATATPSVTAGASSPIAWRPWSGDAFEEARRTGRLVLLHLTASWSHNAHEMDRAAWTDSALVRLVNEGFVPVSVDTDRRPDIGDRYLSSGWPTTAVLDADGQLLLSGAIVAAEPLCRMLGEVRDMVRKNRGEVARRSAESARAVERTWRSEPPAPPEMPLAEWIDRNLAAVREAEDKTQGGFGTAPKMPQFESISFLLAAAAARGDSTLRSIALRGMDAALRLEDSTWGGFFRLALETDWKRPRTEKLLDVNARAIGALAKSAAATGSVRYRAAARRAERYAAAWLWDERRGGFFGSQDADAAARDPSRAPVLGDVFYRLSDRARKRQGAPAVDSAFYADANAHMVSALLAGARAGFWDGAPVQRGLRALDRLWAEQRAPDGSLYHVSEKGTASLPGLLADQAATGLSFLDAYEAANEPRHLERARALARFIRERLEDPIAGGFRYAVRDTAAVGRLRAGDKPEAANVEAATLFLRLWEVGGKEEDLRSATRALDTLRSGDVLVLDPARAELGLRVAGLPKGR